MPDYIKNYTLWLQLIGVFVFGFVFATVISSSVFAQGYGDGPYGGCQYAQTCDTDGDDSTSQDTRRELKDQSQVLATVDGDGDGNNELFVDEDGDNSPDTYTDPDQNSSTPVVVDQNDDGEEIWLFDSDADGDLDSFYNPSTGEIGQLEQEQDPAKAESEANPPQAASSSSGQRAITGGNFGGELYQNFGNLLKQLPQPIANSTPFLLLFLIGLAAGRFVAQERGEYKRAKQLLAFFEQEKQLFFEKNNFVMLVSHYLRTPLTKIKAGVELMVGEFGADSAVRAMNQQANTLAADIDQVVSDIENNQDLQQIQGATQSSAQVLGRSAPRFVVPMVLFVLFGFGLRFVLVDFRIIDANWLELVIELVIGALLIQWFYSALRKRQIARQNRLEQQQLIDEQSAIDQSRNQVIQTGQQTVERSLSQLNTSLPAIRGKPQYDTIKNGIAQLSSVTTRFSLLGQLRSKVVGQQTDIFSVYDLLQQVVSDFAAEIKQKNLTVSLQAVEFPSVEQHPQLLKYVLNTALSNAVKYAPQASTITVSGDISSDDVVISVIDQGQGIAEAKLASLFKPFYRAEDSEHFNQEGLGFNLYLSRIIMRYLGGDITMESQLNNGTTLIARVPLVYRYQDLP